MSRVGELFRRHNIRNTAQRRAIFSALEATEEHPTAGELHRQLAHLRPSVSLATVYNTLDLFTRKGLVRRYLATGGGRAAGTSGRDEAARYDADVGSHLHIIDDDGKLRDVPADLARALIDGLPASVLEQIEDRMGVRIDRVRIELAATRASGRSC